MGGAMLRAHGEPGHVCVLSGCLGGQYFGETRVQHFVELQDTSSLGTLQDICVPLLLGTLCHPSPEGFVSPILGGLCVTPP